MKEFIIIGNENSIADKDIFLLIKKNELWLGINLVKEFIKPTGEIQKFGNICWYTNIENKKHATPIDLYKKYSNEYPHYVNYDGIDCKNVSDIPFDYDGNIGVPISFLENYCPAQFEIVGLSTGKLAKEIGVTKGHRAKCGYGLEIFQNGKYIEPYKRILIRKRKVDADDDLY